MPEEQLRDIVEAMRARIQAELDAQLQALTTRHQQALDHVRASTETEAEQRWAARIEGTRREAETEAEKRWASRVDAIRSEWSARLDSEVTAARNDAEKRLVAESMRVRVEAEQSAAEAAAAQRREMEQAVSAERQRAEARQDAERKRAEQELQQTRDALDAARGLAEAQLAARSEAPALDPDGILSVMRSIDAAASLSDALSALAGGAAAHGVRSAVFIVNGNRLDEWNADAAATLSAGSFRVDAPDAGILGEAARQGRTVSSTRDDHARRIPGFARLTPDRTALAVPIIVGGHVVAVLYGDDGAQSQTGPPATWLTPLELLGHHASACLERLTAVRSMQLLQSGNGAAIAPASSAPSVSEDDQSARRYARLLVSEIKLYNEAAVRAGREKRDLLERLKPEIERARRLYEERVSPDVTARGFYFHQELVQTLAGGDPGLLGA